MKKIVLVEDEQDLAENIKDILIALEYEVLGVFTNGKDVLEFLETNPVDLVLMDILIHGELDGIDLTFKIKEDYNAPVIFITAYSDKGILDRISELVYDGYLLKPFSIESLRSSIYLSLNNNISNKKHTSFKNSLKIRDKGFLVPVPTNEILFLKADGLYTKIITKSKTYLIRDILKDVKGKLPENLFIRVHKSFTVNVEFITSFNSKEITIMDYTIPIRRGFYKELRKIYLLEGKQNQ
jgi:DNA-binding LytR/AlgR family response regulator